MTEAAPSRIGGTKIGWRITGVMLLMTILMSATYVFMSYRRLRKTALDEIDRKLLVATDMAREALPDNYHDNITDGTSVGTEEYLKIVHKFDSLCQAHDLEYVWSLMEVDGVTYFTSGTSQKKYTHEKHASFFEVHSNPSAFAQAFETMEVQHTYITDKWGPISATLAPARDIHGRKHLFGASMKLGDVEIMLNDMLVDSVVIGIALCLLGFVASLLVGHTITRPISRLTKKVQSVSPTDLAQPVNVEGSYELRVLATAFNTLNRTIQESVENLQQSEQKHRTLVENLPQRIFLKDTKSFYISCNANYAADLGIDQDDIAGKSDFDFYPKSLAEKYRADDSDIMSTGQTRMLEEAYLTNGKELVIQTVKTPVRDNQGEVVGLLGIFWDISERIRAEEQRLNLERQVQHAQKLESLGVLAGGIAHDFNNLLMAILGNADLAMDDLAPHAPARENINEILKASKRAAELAKQMLAYSGKGKFVIEPIKLNEFVEEMAHLLEVSISKKAVLKYNFANNLPTFDGDATQIRQIIMNLITNASEAIGDKSGVIALSTGAMNCDKDYLSSVNEILRASTDKLLPEGVYTYFEVADTGCGMNTETQEKIFDPFFTTKFTGRGLGMAAVLGIVRGHGGAIKIYSEPGKGSTFKVLFPANELPENGSATKKHAVSVTKEWQGSGTILIADDEETVCAVGKQMLTRMGFDVLTAADGREAVDLFKQNADDIVCVLMDLTMPHMDGEQAFRQLRRIQSDVAVILCSGYNKQDATQRFAGKGLAGFVQKPYSMATLQDKLMEVLPGDQA
ncbi:MAG: response regulator [Phycisphaerales bacterium]|nr:response regulator [Phycisphaerales bacterium]